MPLANAFRSPLGTTAKVKTKVKGLVATQQLLQQIVYAKPLLAFLIGGQIIVDEKNNFVPSFDLEMGDLEKIETEFHFKIEPEKLTARMQNRVAAIQERINAAQGVMDAMFKASGQIENAKHGVTMSDLPDADLLVELFAERDAAENARLVECVATNSSGHTMWDYFDEDGNFPILTVEFLEKNPRVATAMRTAFNEWLFPTKNSSGATTKAKPETGKKAPTTWEATPETRTASSFDSPMLSTAENKAPDETTGQSTDTSPDS